MRLTAGLGDVGPQDGDAAVDLAGNLPYVGYFHQQTME